MADGPDQTVFAWTVEHRDDAEVPREQHGVSPVVPEDKGARFRARERRSAGRDLDASTSRGAHRDGHERDLPPETELWRIAHAAQFLKMSPSWIYKRVERGELPCVRVNGWALRFIPADLRAWAESQAKRRSR